MKVIPTEEIEWETVVANARAGHVQRKHVREGEILPGVGYASDCYNYVAATASSPRRAITMTSRRTAGTRLCGRTWASRLRSLANPALRRCASPSRQRSSRPISRLASRSSDLETRNLKFGATYPALDLGTDPAMLRDWAGLSRDS
jgi:hypothetical protein